ncbi:RidA family protein [Candidatus Pantoea multigeneris]|uniref:RidA family protein n=1 Tax=Candidatus Pantoea multigeneris TaxID=2608357 RepID=A0ABX0RDW9_9GAMM|nr:RidA family protein [Pantoea multigeneris]NIF21864.1 RidA family protein [Pantoea multigeneris]
MTITRIDVAPRMSEAVIHNDTVYYTSVPEDLTGDAEAQTADALAVIDRILARVGSDKSKILDATIFLTEKADFDAMNRAWDAWVSPDNAPVRCTVQAGLMDPQFKVEIKVIAAL